MTSSFTTSVKYFRAYLCPKLLLSAFFLLILPLSAQEVMLKGKIRDANTHRPLSGVNIFVPDVAAGTVSNSAGWFELTVVAPEPDMIVSFQHIAYDTLKLTVEDILSNKHFDLQERVINSPTVNSESIEDQLGLDTDLQQSVSIIEARIFDLHGYADAGDLLQTDHSIQVDEELSGKKTVAIRGGSPDEVIVLFNGIKMNSALDNIFDISLIDVTDLERFEVIKGSNTALYGPDAFSGVVNVIPRAKQDYNIRFKQKFGSYDTGQWGLNLYKNLGRMDASYSVKKGGSRRKYANEPQGRQLLEKLSEHHTASVGYNISETPSGSPKSHLGIMYIRSELDYENERDNETLQNFNQMITGRYTGNLGEVKNLNVSGAYQWLDETQFLRFFESEADSGFLERTINNRTVHFNADKSIHYKNADWLLGYQFRDARLDIDDDQIVASNPLPFKDGRLTRKHHGLVSIARYRPEVSGRQFMNGPGFDLSLRYDIIQDELIDPDFTNPDNNPIASAEGVYRGNTWKEGMAKFSSHISGNNGRTAFNAFATVGSNVKFPTLLQQTSTTEVLNADTLGVLILEPERNRSLEVGLELMRETRSVGLYGWEASVNYFLNNYDNKLRQYFLPGTPVAFYDNVPTASISGVESRQSFYLFKKKMTMQFGASRYFFSDPATFSFKHDRKFTFDIFIDQSGYFFQLHAFREGEQIAQLRNGDGTFSQVDVPTFTNIDLHFSKAFELNKMKLILNASMRNLLDDDYELEGLTLRDQRFYFTLGLQY